MIYFIRIQSEKMKMTREALGYLYFVLFATFSSVMALQFCK